MAFDNKIIHGQMRNRLFKEYKEMNSVFEKL